MNTPVIRDGGAATIFAPRMRHGIVKITELDLMMDLHSGKIPDVFELGQIRVLHHWQQRQDREYVYMCESPLFDELKPGDPVPLYVLRATRNNGELVSVTAERARPGVLAQNIYF